MKRKYLPKGIVITSIALSTMLITTGCYDSNNEIINEIIDDYDPSEQNEVEVYGPIPLQIQNNDEKDTKISEENNQTKTENDYYSEEPICVYGPSEIYD